MHCPQCGETVADGAKFCAHCGARLPHQHPAPNVPPAPAPGSTSIPAPAPAQAHAPAAAPGGANTPAQTTTVRITPAHLSAFGVSLGIGLAAAIALALITTLLAMTSFTDLVEQGISSQSSYSQSELAQIYNPNFFQNLVLALTAGVSGGLSFTANAPMVTTNALTFSVPMSLVGVALLAGAAFGAYMMARRTRMPFRWAGVVSSLLVGAASGLVVLILAAIFRVTIAYDTVTLTLSGATFRTFALTFLLATAGALGGYFLADAAPDSTNVFTAAWRWAHRARGAVRTIIESAAIFALVFTVIGVIAVCIIATKVTAFPLMSIFPMLLPMAPFYALVLASFGGIEANIPGTTPQTLSIFNFDDLMPAQVNLTWLLWIMFAVAIICALYTAVRAGARNYYDPHYASWSTSWQAPVFWFAFWLICPYLIMAVQFNVAGQTTSAMPALWFSLVAAVWAFLIEVCARVLAPVIIQSAPGMWKCFVGGTVRPDPFAGQSRKTAAAPTASTTAATPATPAAPVAAAPASPMYPPAANTVSRATSHAPMAVPAAAPVATATLTAKQKRGWIIAGIVTGVIVLFGVTYAILNATMFSATSVGKSYIAAIEDGNFDEANKLANPQAKPEQAKLLANQAAPGNDGRITNAQIVSERTTGNAKTLTVSYTLDGKQTTRDLNMIKKGSKALIFSDWVVAEPLTTTVTVSYPESVGEVTINGVTVSAANAKSSDGAQHSFVVYPGSYDVSAAKSKYYTQQTVTAVAGTDSTGSVYDLDVEPSDDLTSAISEKVDAKLDECAKSKNREPADCPLSAGYFFGVSDTRNFSWSITDYPKVTADDVSLDNGAFSVYGGDAKYTYEYKSSDGWKPENGSATIGALSGTFTIDGDKLDVKFASD